MKLSQKRVNDLLIKRSQLNDQIAQLQEEVKLCEDTIKTYMEAEDMEVLKTDMWTVYYEEQIKYSFNKADFIKAYSQDLYEQFKTKMSTSRPFKPYPNKKV